jgi:hypothetical protein
MFTAGLGGQGRRRRHVSVFFITVTLIAAALPLEAQQQSQLANISTRMLVDTGENALIAGFMITGTEPKKVILRAIGPSLANGGVSGVLADPTLELFRGETSLGFNDNWKDDAVERAEIEASTIPPSNDLESGIVRTLEPGVYTAVMRGKGETSGVGLVELYDLDTGAESKLVNIATRGLVQTGSNVMIAGTIVIGGAASSQRVLIRATGPSLSIAGRLADPTLELIDGNGNAVRANDNWRSEQEAPIRASTIPPASELEAAVVATLQPGNYTAVVRGAGGSTGVAVVEVYTLDNNYGAWPLLGDDPNLGTTADLEPCAGWSATRRWPDLARAGTRPADSTG